MFGAVFENLTAGMDHSPAQAQSLEIELIENPGDLNKRLQLIGFYRRRQADFQKRIRHILYLIEHAPESLAWRHRVLTNLEEYCAPEDFELAKACWLAAVEKCENNGDVFGNAGLFLIERDLETGTELLMRAMALQPEDDFWPGEVSRFNYWKAQSLPIEERHDAAAKSLHAGQRFLELFGQEGARKNSVLRERALFLCARCAIWTNDIDAASMFTSAYAELVEGRGESRIRDLLFGLIACHSSLFEEAQEALLAVDGASGVNDLQMELASELEKRGFHETVTKFKTLCPSTD